MTSAPSTAATQRILPWLVAVAFFMESLDTTILNTAVPTIAHALDIGALSMKAALTSYTLSLAIFIPISGWIADRYGTRRVFFSAITIFAVGSLSCGLSVNMPMLVAARVLQGCGGALMMPVGRITMVRTFPKSELVRAMSFVAIPGLIGPLVGPLAGGLIVGYLHWRMIFFVNLPIAAAGMYFVLKYMPDYRAARREPLDFIGLVLFGAGVALLSYVLEIFGEHSLSLRAMAFLLALAVLLLLAYARHAFGAPHPLLRLTLFRIRTFRSAVVGSFVTRLGVGGMPFLLPLLYQIGLGFSPVQSGLMIMPQALAAISFKFTLPIILRRFGHRQVLIANTVMLGVMLMLFSLVGGGTPGWLLAFLAFAFGFFTSTQYTSMNTLAYADVSAEQASGASTIASTVQQMAVSFGVAAASLTAAVFIPDQARASGPQMIHGIHLALRALGAWTVVSTLVFSELTSTDGEAVSAHKAGVSVASA